MQGCGQYKQKWADLAWGIWCSGNTRASKPLVVGPIPAIPAMEIPTIKIEGEKDLEEFARVLELAATDMVHMPADGRDKLNAAAKRVREVLKTWGYGDRDVVKYIWTGVYEGVD